MLRFRTWIALAITLGVVLVAGTACGSDSAGSAGDQPARSSGPDQSGERGPSTSVGAEMFPDVLDVEIEPTGDGQFMVSTTLSSPYDTPERYADAWRVLDTDGTELGRRELDHDHAGEQPFTRSETIAIPDGVDEITVQGRDQTSGYGGKTVTVAVPR